MSVSLEKFMSEFSEKERNEIEAQATLDLISKEEESLKAASVEMVRNND